MDTVTRRLQLKRLLALGVALLLIISVQFASSSKHHRKHLQCSEILSQSCPVHKHKICGSDGKLYPSPCHLRRIACTSGISLHPAHPDRCLREEDIDTSGDNPNASLDNTSTEQQTSSLNEFANEEYHLVNVIPVDGNDHEKLNKINNNNENFDDGDDEECQPKEYDLMKEAILSKIKDVSLLFVRLDENNDGHISLNELWKHSSLYRQNDCLLTDLMQHEDTNHDIKLDAAELQAAFNRLYSVSMVSLDEDLAVNRIEAHSGDNVEIRCDITGEPRKPAIRWLRHGLDLSTLPLSSSIKVSPEGSLYLTNIDLSLSSNYTCQAINNPSVVQVHVLKVIVAPLVQVWPEFQWAPLGGVAVFECRYETFDDIFAVKWTKNSEDISEVTDNDKTTLMNNSTRLQIAALEQTDTGAYSCKVQHLNGVHSSSVASLLVQEESVEPKTGPETHRPERLWIFHATGISIQEGVCGQTVHEFDSRESVHGHSVTLCANDPTGQLIDSCDWSSNVLTKGDYLFIAQPTLNRILVFSVSQMTLHQILATDSRPSKLWLVENEKEMQVWVLCEGSPLPTMHSSMSSKANNNRKTIQVVRMPESEHRKSKREHRIRQEADVIHLQPVNGHFDLVYDLFMPNHYDSIFHSSSSHFEREHNQQWRALKYSSQFAFGTHWNERSMVKIGIRELEYINSVRLADCHPITASIVKRRGLVIVQCETPITTKLNGQIVLDLLTDTILHHNPTLNAHQSYLSPDERYLVSILHKPALTFSAENGHERNSDLSTIIVQKITDDGIQFLYDVRTSLEIVNCAFVWKNGAYDLVLASANGNREDLLYLFLTDGHVELISGIGRPTQKSHRALALSTKNRILAITATESIFTVDLNTNRIICESNKHFERPQSLIWTQ